ncbi:hypothetical protein [Streptomyces sp. NBC_01803]|uniref:hypothetical protein n=1 Tax=Streptomyces sp. NBC_01803 TaxID=2975946 RepID=UPI002DDA0938|nr:hypothetical protein [Streptomyces sp. NBC_01803]WSA44530.1 hypothetical protein OIE51_10125 [Streptomyces sp. NBC_01803]
MPGADEMDDDEFFATVRGLGAATNAAHDQSLSQEARDLTADLGGVAADRLRGNDE